MQDIQVYETTLDWIKGKEGILKVEGFPDINVAPPPQFKGGVPDTWSPEHLYIASVNACLMSTFLAIAENSKLDFISYKSVAAGKIEMVDDKFMFTEIELNPKVVIKEERQRERTLRILEKAKHHCLISNSVKTTVILSPKITTA